MRNCIRTNYERKKNMASYGYDLEDETTVAKTYKRPYCSPWCAVPYKTEEELMAFLKTTGTTYHHTSYVRWYEPRRNNAGSVEDYKGKFGEGYRVYRPNWKSTQYSFVDYYIYR